MLWQGWAYFLGISSWMCWVTEIGRERIYSAPSSSNASPSDTVRGEWRRTWPTKRKTREDFNFWGVPNVMLIEKHVPVVKDTCKSWCFSNLFKPWYSKFIWVSKKTYELRIVDISELIHISLSKEIYLKYLMIWDTLIKFSLKQV